MSDIIFPKSILQVKIAMIFLVLLFMVLPNSLQASSSQVSEGISNKNPGSDLWRNVRQRNFPMQGTSQIKSVDSDILINDKGDQWARFRMGTLISFGQYVLGVIIMSIILFYLIRGKVRLEGGLSGRMVKRFDEFERTLHWTFAILFIFLACTGLILLFGRSLLIPVFGHEIFSIIASSGKEGHNLFGPIFIFTLLLMFYQFVRRNIYEKGDLTWLLKGGGFIGKSHVSGGFFNMGEKTLYWLVVLIGIVLSVSGLILLLPVLGQGRIIMGWAHIFHGIGAITLIAVVLGHIYLATLGSEGTLDGMKTGYVDIKWAEQHHDRWAKQCHENDLIISSEEFDRVQGKEAINLGVHSPALEKSES